MNDDDCIVASQPAGDALMQVVEGVAVFGEDDQFLLGRTNGAGNGAGAVGRRRLGERVDEQVIEELRQLGPLWYRGPPRRTRPASVSRAVSVPISCFNSSMVWAGGGLVEGLRLPALRSRSPGLPPGLPSLRCRRSAWPVRRRKRPGPCVAVPPAPACGPGAVRVGGAGSGRWPRVTRRGGAGEW